MKIFITTLYCVFAGWVIGQPDSPVLATAAGKNFTVDSLGPEARRLYDERGALLATYRSELLSEMVNNAVLQLEAKQRRLTADKLLAPIVATVPNPTAAEIKELYEVNRSQLRGRTLEQVKSGIVEHLRVGARQRVLGEYLRSLRLKHNVSKGKDPNAPGLFPSNVLATIGSKQITAREFRENTAAALNDREFSMHGEIIADLETTILSVLIQEEARASNMDAHSFIAAEVTNKIRSHTPAERQRLESELQMRLFTKYNVKLLLSEPKPLVQQISADDDPALGPADAAVTIVMFSDFECPACAAAHPLLKQAIDEFPGKVRLIVRDYPLTNIHKNALLAARAANAANAQGKFFEYAELLYANQDSLGRGSLQKYAIGIGLNMKRFELDFYHPKTAAEIQNDIRDGQRYGVSWTPSIYVNGVKIHGSRLDDYRSAIVRAFQKR